MKKLLIELLLFTFLAGLFLGCSAPTGNSESAPQQVKVLSDENGMKLTINDKDFFIYGMNWDYFPIGKNFMYNIWDQDEAMIKKALEAEMSLLKKIGCNAIRVYTGIPPRWIEYIYEEYGIYTMLNHSFGRYGLTIEDQWIDPTDYSSSGTRDVLLHEVTKMAQDYRNTPGLLLYLLGNENNYGLFWEGDETEDFPPYDESVEAMATAMYKLFDEATVAIRKLDPNHPVAICNGDLQFIDIIKKECSNADIFGVNMYRGKSFTDAFIQVKEILNKPFLFTEFGADAYNVLTAGEDQWSQAEYLVFNWQEIIEQAYGMGRTGISLGGFTFQFSDGWWKYGQTVELDIHNTQASWANGGYLNDYEEGTNNMNEEWFGICAKGPSNDIGLYPLYPRAAYYVLGDIHNYNPFENNNSSPEQYFRKINIEEAIQLASSKNEQHSGSHE
jgi:hypothetical protein